MTCPTTRLAWKPAVVKKLMMTLYAIQLVLAFGQICAHVSQARVGLAETATYVHAMVLLQLIPAHVQAMAHAHQWTSVIASQTIQEPIASLPHAHVSIFF